MADFVDLNSLQQLLAPGLTLQEALECLIGDGPSNLRPHSVFVEPPSPTEITDEESGNEDDEVGDVRHLSGRQLLAPAEIVFQGFRTAEEPPSVVDDSVSPLVSQDSEGNHPVAPILNQTTPPPTISSAEEEWKYKRLIKGKPMAHFIEADLQSIKPTFPTAALQPRPLSCSEVFERFFTDEVFEHIVDETRKYALYKNSDDPKITKDEIKCFFGFMILSGYLNLPSERSYWEDMPDFKNELVCNAMRRNRMQIIKRFIHFADNHNVDAKDKIWKLRPLMDKIKKQCFSNFTPTENLNYDESMVKFFSKHSLKQFLPGKPIRFGYKMWCVNSSDGYLLNFDLYQGSNPKLTEVDCKLFGKCSAPFVMMLKELPEEIQKLPFSFYFDNLFSGVNLFRFMKIQGYSATGTFRENRIPILKSKKTGRRSKNFGSRRPTKKKISNLPDKKTFSKLTRGSIKSYIEKNDGIIFIRWKDNGVLTMGSTDYGVHPLSSVKRWSAEKKKNVTCDRPLAVAQYNKGMGGTDLMDSNISAYRIGLRSKKFYWVVFTWLVDAMIQNAWIVYRQHSKISQLQFRREIAVHYLTTFATKKNHPGPSAPIKSRFLADTRYDDRNHLIQKIPDDKRWRCALESCKSRSRYMCEKCGVGLCVECFLPFHRV